MLFSVFHHHAPQSEASKATSWQIIVPVRMQKSVCGEHTPKPMLAGLWTHRERRELTSEMGSSVPTHYKLSSSPAEPGQRFWGHFISLYTLKIIKSKCLPLLLYGLEVCPLTVSDSRSLDFVINRFFMKLFCTNVMDTVKICQDYFNFELPSSIIEKRRKTFVARCVPVS